MPPACCTGCTDGWNCRPSWSYWLNASSSTM